MKLEYLAEGAADCPLVRLYDLTPVEVQRLRDLVKALANGTRERVAVHELPGVTAIEGCTLTLRIGSDRGVYASKAGGFECLLSATWWDNMEGLLEPFCTPNSGAFQWLTNFGPIRLLISRDGGW